MYFGSPVAGPFTVGVSVLSLILCLKKKKKKSVLGHFPAPLKPDAVLHSLKPQSTLRRGDTKWQSALEMHHVDTGESTPLHTASLSD